MSGTRSSRPGHRQRCRPSSTSLVPAGFLTKASPLPAKLAGGLAAPVRLPGGRPPEPEGARPASSTARCASTPGSSIPLATLPLKVPRPLSRPPAPPYPSQPRLPKPRARPRMVQPRRRPGHGESSCARKAWTVTALTRVQIRDGDGGAQPRRSDPRPSAKPLPRPTRRCGSTSCARPNSTAASYAGVGARIVAETFHRAMEGSQPLDRPRQELQAPVRPPTTTRSTCPTCSYLRLRGKRRAVQPRQNPNSGLKRQTRLRAESGRRGIHAAEWRPRNASVSRSLSMRATGAAGATWQRGCSGAASRYCLWSSCPDDRRHHGGHGNRTATTGGSMNDSDRRSGMSGGSSGHGSSALQGDVRIPSAEFVVLEEADHYAEHISP